jgi:hemerythrin HHE cation binding domain-containing protein
MAPTLAPAAHELLADHARLRDGITTLRATLRGPISGANCVAAGERLLNLRRQLARHFRDEEESGLFERILADAPQTEPSCARLLDEHRRILYRLDVLQMAGREVRDAAGARVWRTAIASVLGDLDRHEKQEAALLLGTLAPEGGAPD